MRASVPESWGAKHVLPFTITPSIQLLAVIPPASAHILPKPLQKLMQVPEHRHLFPDGFRVHTWPKQVAWEVMPQLPPIDIVRLHGMVEGVAESAP